MARRYTFVSMQRWDEKIFFSSPIIAFNKIQPIKNKKIEDKFAVWDFKRAILILWKHPHNSFIHIYFFTVGLMSADIIALPGVLAAHTLTPQACNLTS